MRSSAAGVRAILIFVGLGLSGFVSVWIEGCRARLPRAAHSRAHHRVLRHLWTEFPKPALCAFGARWHGC